MQCLSILRELHNSDKYRISLSTNVKSRKMNRASLVGQSSFGVSLFWSWQQSGDPVIQQSFLHQGARSLSKSRASKFCILRMVRNSVRKGLQRGRIRWLVNSRRLIKGPPGISACHLVCYYSLPSIL